MKTKKLAALILSLVVLTTLAACGKGGNSAPKEPVMTTFQTNDGNVSLTVPDSWTTRQTDSEDIILAIEDSSAELDAIMFSDPLDGASAGDYLASHLEELKASSEGVEYSAPSAITVNGINTFFSEYSEKTDSGTDKYIFAAYDVKGTVYEILVSTTAEKYDANKKAMMDLVNSLKAI